MSHYETSTRTAARRIAWTFAVLLLWTCAPSTEADGESEEKMTYALPGAAPYSEELQERLRAAVAAKGDAYEPRTHHLNEDGGAVYTNRLIFEDSPYLLQHAHNPVDWYAWGEEAFARARREEKPIFLSIGYSTCHWCHVMERESFESAEIARIMNERFVCIKVDREQRPDVDDIYMTAVQLRTGGGGWPMSSFLTPEGQPFFGGTYFPPHQFTDLLTQVAEAWQTRRPELIDAGRQMAEAVAEVLAARGEAKGLAEEAFGAAVDQILGRYEPRRGGFGGAPKFPQEPWLLYLLDRVLRGDERPLGAVRKSLDEMARGGIYDQVGGGFHRYSVDDEWLVPHFEKMLYNQAHLARAYLTAYELSGDRFFARVARQTLDYVEREMVAPGGGFYSATDADSEGEEGLFFLWTTDELRKVLGKDDGDLAIDLYGATAAGNFEGRNILHLPVGLDAYAAAKGMKRSALLGRVDAIREKLRQEREKREHPLRDDKVLTSWNGMMITAFAAGADVLGEPRYLETGRAAAEFLWEHNRRGEGDLWRVHLEGSSSVGALQDDYAYFAEALLALYDQTGEPLWLERAREVADGMIRSFWDDEAGGFFLSAEDADPHLIARPKSPLDGAVPSGNSVAVVALAQLAARTGEARYREHAERSLAAFGALIERQPAGFGYMLMGAADLIQGGTGRRVYSSAGTVRATARLSDDGDGVRFEVELKMRDGWHVNAHEPLQEELVATELQVVEDGWELAETVYPEGRRVKLGFQEQPLLVYEGTVPLSGRLRRVAGSGPVRLKLRLQACDDEKCLRPEWVALVVPTGTFAEEN